MPFFVIDFIKEYEGKKLFNLFRTGCFFFSLTEYLNSQISFVIFRWECLQGTFCIILLFVTQLCSLSLQNG
jgi:hypothetical protein